MKTTKTPQISRRERRLAELQVREYCANYHPELKDAIVEISPYGQFASVRKIPDKPPQPGARGRRSR